MRSPWGSLPPGLRAAYPLEVLRHFAIRLIGLALISVFAFSPPANAGTPIPPALFTGGDICALVEGVPTGDHPLAATKALKRVMAAYLRAEQRQAPMARVYKRLNRVVRKALKTGASIFHPKGKKSPSPSAAQRFLKTYIFGAAPLLAVGDWGFEPQPAVRAWLVYTACRGGHPAAAQAWARRAQPASDPSARAFAGIVALENGAEADAQDLALGLDADAGGFLVPWLLTELSSDPSDRRRLHGLAVRRITTPAQSAAVRAQAARLALPPI